MRGEQYQIIDARGKESIEFLSKYTVPLNRWERVPYKIHLDPSYYILLDSGSVIWEYLYAYWVGEREGQGEESRQITPHLVFVFKASSDTGDPEAWRHSLQQYLEDGGSLLPPMEFWKSPHHRCIHREIGEGE